MNQTWNSTDEAEFYHAWTFRLWLLFMWVFCFSVFLTFLCIERSWTGLPPGGLNESIIQWPHSLTEVFSPKVLELQHFYTFASPINPPKWREGNIPGGVWMNIPSTHRHTQNTLLTIENATEIGTKFGVKFRQIFFLPLAVKDLLEGNWEWPLCKNNTSFHFLHSDLYSFTFCSLSWQDHNMCDNRMLHYLFHFEYSCLHWVFWCKKTTTSCNNICLFTYAGDNVAAKTVTIST